MEKNVLVLNMGMKSIRSIIFDSRGNKLSSASRPLTTGLNEKQVFQDPNEWWSSAAVVIRESLFPLKNIKIDYLTVTSSASCLVYVDQECNPLDMCIMVSDKRSEEEGRRIAATNAIRAVASSELINISTGSMLSKMLWVREKQPDIFRKIYKFLSPNDFLLAKMTGLFVTDGFNASKCLYDVGTGRYPEALLEELEIGLELLPKVVDVGTNIGNLTAAAASHLGLSQSVEVVVTAYDAICSFFGSGVTQEGDASDVSGTVTVLRALSYRDDLLPNGKVFTVRHPQKNLHIVGGSNNLGGGLIEWTKQCLYSREEFPYEMMEQEAAQSTIGAYGLIFLPYLLGERAPIWDNTVRGMFFGLERYHTRKDIVRAVFESTGFIDMDFIQEIENTGVKVNSIRLSGGLARVPLIAQIKADITGRDILVLSEFETTSTGAAMMVLEAVGVFSDIEEAARRFAKVRMIVKPDLQNHSQYQKVYQFFKDIYHSTTDLFRKRDALYHEMYPSRDYRTENL